MATPKAVWKTKILLNETMVSKEILNKTVVQEVTITNPSTTNVTMEIYRTPFSERNDPVSPVQDLCKIKTSFSISANQTVVFSNLRWVFGEGDYLAFTKVGNGTVVIYVDGVEFD